MLKLSCIPRLSCTELDNCGLRSAELERIAPWREDGEHAIGEADKQRMAIGWLCPAYGTHLRACVRACVRAVCMCECVYVRARMCVHACVRAHACVHVRDCVWPPF